MTVTVTQQDINNGHKRNCGHCPIALAVRRVIPDVYVGGYHVFIDEIATYKLPDVAIEFIKAFDNERPVKPFSFDIERLHV